MKKISLKNYKQQSFTLFCQKVGFLNIFDYFFGDR